MRLFREWGCELRADQTLQNKKFRAILAPVDHTGSDLQVPGVTVGGNTSTLDVLSEASLE